MSRFIPQKLSALRRLRVDKARHGAASGPTRTPLRSILGPLRIFFAGFALSLLLMAVERFAIPAIAGWLGLGKFIGDRGLTTFPSLAMPFVFASLYGPAAAAVTGIASALVAWCALRFNPCTLVSIMCGTLWVAALAHRVRKAADLAILALQVFTLQVLLCALLFKFCNVCVPEIETCEAWEAAALLALHMVAVPFCVSVALPLAERVSGLASDRTLATFANLEHPLLQRLSREAPGTYGHCMVVADIASAAAESIGANPLLARLGGYYHDIGKLSSPRYFMENQSLLGNPHDTLPPSVSAMIIASHVKDGLVLAREYRLPQAIVRIIASHHGTSSMAWFRMKAENQAASGGAGAADAWPYRYPGPLPCSREETIVSLADGIEAASRSLLKPDMSDLVRLVAKICDSRMADGQFVKSAISISELEIVKKSFVGTLVHRLHARAAYPGKN